MSTEMRPRVILKSVVSVISARRCSSGFQFSSVSVSVTLALLFLPLQVARKKSKRQKRAAKKAEEDFLYKVMVPLVLCNM